MTQTLTPRQQQVLDFITDCLEAGHPPSYREIMDHFGWCSTNAVADHVRALVAKGALIHEPWKSRSLRLPGPTRVDRWTQWAHDTFRLDPDLSPADIRQHVAARLRAGDTTIIRKRP